MLDERGCFEALRRHPAAPDRVEIRATGGELLKRPTVPADQTLSLAIYRANLHASLRETVPADRNRMGTEPTSIDKRADGVTARAEGAVPLLR